MKLWDKGYELDRQVEAFTAGEDYMLDQWLVRYDCLGSIAHAEMLGKAGFLAEDEVSALTAELENIIELNTQGKFVIRKDQEDCHTAIENHLIERLGDTGKKIHTARSRNDQVLTALRLYYKDELAKCTGLVQELGEALGQFAGKFGTVEIPGYTHTRKAMPSSAGMWAGAFADSMQDNAEALQYAMKLIDVSPLGSGAGYGVPLAIDREYTAQKLGFRAVQENPVHVQISRGKFEADIVHALGRVVFDINRMSCDLITFSMPEFGYFELPDEFCTGSSIMPQKKNPDALELLRAHYHTVVSYEFQIKNTAANLISGYNRDLQLTKGPVMRSLAVTQECLRIMTLLMQKLRVNREKCEAAMTEELYATEEVYKLVGQGVPFREAYRRIAQRYM